MGTNESGTFEIRKDDGFHFVYKNCANREVLRSRTYAKKMTAQDAITTLKYRPEDDSFFGVEGGDDGFTYVVSSQTGVVGTSIVAADLRESATEISDRRDQCSDRRYHANATTLHKIIEASV